MMHLRLQSLLKVLVLSITILVFHGCVTPYSSSVPAEPPSLSDFSTQEIDNLVAQAARPTTLMEHNLSASDLIGEWDLMDYFLVSGTTDSSLNGYRNSIKTKTGESVKSRYQFFENNTFRMYFNRGQNSSAGRYTYDNGVLTLFSYEEGAFRPSNIFQVIAFSPNAVELKMLDFEVAKACFTKGIIDSGKKIGSRNEVLFVNYWLDSNNCLFSESVCTYYDLASGANFKMHCISVYAPKILHKSNIKPVKAPTEEEMGVGKEKVEEAYIPPVQSQPPPTQDSGANVMQAIAGGINTFNQQMQQNAPQYQPPPSPTPRTTPVAPAQTNTQRTVTPTTPNFKRFCPRTYKNGVVHGEWDSRFSAGCPACRGTINW